MSVCIRTENLCVGYTKDSPILNDINLTINEGDMCTLSGSNGSGKSTFIKTISGLIKKCCGEYILAENTRISHVPQFKKLQYHYPLKVKDMLLLSPSWSFKKKSLTEENRILLEKLNILRIENQLIRECSGGQLQKVLIARSLLADANLVFLDEPLDALDSDSKRTITSLLREEALKKHRTFFIITHNEEKSWLVEFNRRFYIEGMKIKERK